jgi:2-oxoglutarate ferredoxin oxidoreductase subunit beta
MSYINKPKVAHPSLPTNSLGMTRRQYEGSMSTLCAGCGHDSVTAAIIEACWGLALHPEQLVKLSGIGCSSKTTAYFVSGSHGFNSVHGRMPSIASGANAANRRLTYVGVSGDGDSLSIGIGQLVHAIRRNVNMLYLIENNGVYGLTKGQFSASADIGTKAKRGDVNSSPPIDPVLLALTLGATFVARSFSGDKAQLVPLIQAGMRHNGFALIDVLSPCVTFNDHEGSTKSYTFTREHYHAAVETDFHAAAETDFHAAAETDFQGAVAADFVPQAREIAVDYAEGESIPVNLHDGSRIVLRKLDPSYDPTDRSAAYNYIETKLKHNEYVTGLIHIDESDSTEFHNLNRTAEAPLNSIPYEKLSPGRAALDKLMARYR